jgi:ABC-2 type transport system ATP-binding protein
MDALKYEEVSKSFGEKKAVNNVCFSVEEGQIFGLLGPNGAGKTTLIRMTLGIYLPDNGFIRIFDKSLKEIDDGDLGYLPEERGLYPKMKCKDVLSFFLELKGFSSSQAKKKSLSSLEKVGLEDYANKRIEELSKGMQQKIQLLLALNHNPKIAILDEPFSGLDPVNVDLFKDLIKEAEQNGTTVILSSHQMELVEQLCNKIALINKGNIVLNGEVGEIRKQYGENEIKIEFSGKIPDFNFGEYAEWIKTDTSSLRLGLKKEFKPGDLLEKLVLAKYEIQKFETATASLHDIFVRVVREEGGENEN